MAADLDSAANDTAPKKGSFLDKNSQKIGAAAAVAGVVIGYLIYRHSKAQQAAAANSNSTTAGGGYAYPQVDPTQGAGVNDSSNALQSTSDQYAQLQQQLTQEQQANSAGFASLAAGQQQGFNDVSSSLVGLYAGQQVLGGQRSGSVSSNQSSASNSARNAGTEGQTVAGAQQAAWSTYAGVGPGTPAVQPGSPTSNTNPNLPPFSTVQSSAGPGTF